MKKYRFIIPLLGGGLLLFISCSSHESSNSTVTDTTSNTNQGLTPAQDQPSSSTYNPNQSPVVDTVKQRKDSVRKK